MILMGQMIFMYVQPAIQQLASGKWLLFPWLHVIQSSQIFLDVTHTKSYMILHSECQTEQLICALRSCSVYLRQPHALMPKMWP